MSKLFSKIKNRPVVMGVLNVTPDSFSDGGKYFAKDDAIARALELERDGADIVDIGGESSGPDSLGVSLEEELNRTIPIVQEVRKRSGILISIDTYKAEVARQALDAGADIINDVTALRADENLGEVVSKYKSPVILMYSKDNSARTTLRSVEYEDVVEDIKNFLRKRIDIAVGHGIDVENIILDPGLGHFVSSNPRYSYEIIARLEEFKQQGTGMLLGISRKSFLGVEMKLRDGVALPLSGVAYLSGVNIIRTHDVKGVRDFFLKWN